MDIGIEQARKNLGDIANRASLAGETTYLTRNGKRIAAIVPLETLMIGYIDREHGTWLLSTSLVPAPPAIDPEADPGATQLEEMWEVEGTEEDALASFATHGYVVCGPLREGQRYRSVPLRRA